MKVGKKLRFEILKRDQFKCRYCGRGESDGTKLHVDHVIAVALGGRNDPENLATACVDCNLGKSARMLEDPGLIGVDFEKQRQVFEQAQKSLEQYQAYVKSRKSWENRLISELISPLEPALREVPYWQMREEEAIWFFERGDLQLPFPPGMEDCEMQSQINVIKASLAKTKRSVLYFFKNLGPDAVREAAEIAARQVSLDKICVYSVFAYFCGICHRMIKDREAQAC
jgi:hypothetical protein